VTDAPALGPDDPADAAAMLRRRRPLVEACELGAPTPTARALLPRQEAGAIAVELAAGQQRRPLG
jgi:hypothetical protein